MSNLSTLAVHEYYDELAKALPPPVSDKLEHRERRLSTAIETFQALRPGDAYEARLAVQIVLCGAHAVECLLEAGVYREDFSKRSRCRAQASSLQREERAAKRILVQEQKLRLRTEGVAGALPAYPATASAAPQPAGPQAAPRPADVPAAAAPLRPAAAQAAPKLAAGGSAPSPSPEAIARAEAFMMENEVAAAQIRHDRGVTPQNKAYFHEVTFPTDPAVIDALVRGMSEFLAMLDDLGGENLEAAA
jgi:hypothetical protein